MAINTGHALGSFYIHSSERIDQWEYMYVVSEIPTKRNFYVSKKIQNTPSFFRLADAAASGPIAPSIPSVKWITTYEKTASC